MDDLLVVHFDLDRDRPKLGQLVRLLEIPNADESRLVRAYREFLIIATGSKWMDRLEKWLNFVCPKSVILYAEKPETASARPAVSRAA